MGYIACIVIGFSCICLGCSSRGASNSSHEIDTSENVRSCDYAQTYPASQDGLDIDSLRKYSVCENRNSVVSDVDISVNPYYDEGYDQGLEDGYCDGQENIRGDSYDDACDYRGKKRREYELGYEEGYETGFDDGFADSDYDSELEE